MSRAKLGRRALDLALASALAALVAAGWALANRPVEAPSWSGTLAGLSFSPYRAGQSPLTRQPSEADLRADLALLSGRVRALRLYGTQPGLAAVPRLAAEVGFTVTAGAWVGPEMGENRADLERAVGLAAANPNVTRLLVGNEALLREDVTVDELVGLLRAARARLSIPVSTAEPWHVWLDHPELADEVDFIGLHVLPYWEGVPVDEALAYLRLRLDEVAAAYPGKEIVLTEVGWPSHGRARGGAVPSTRNQSLFLRQFLVEADTRGLDYFVIEAFDQPWKWAVEGGIGAHWGIYDLDRDPKLALDGPLVPVGHWPWLAAGSVLPAWLVGLWLLGRLGAVRAPGRLFLAALVQTIALTAALTVDAVLAHYVSLWGAAALAVLSGAQLLLLLMLLNEGVEHAEVLWRSGWARRAAAAGGCCPAAPAYRPKVSIHVPIRSEPPDMVAETLAALARLDYPDFEVLALVNNTDDPALIAPLASACAALGPRVRLCDLGECTGFKAGALNRGLARTAPDAEIIAVVDSDYTVDRRWLADLVACFADPAVDLVQAPQDFSDGAAGGFKRMAYWEYRAFFKLGMVLRNERNAIIQHGTMTMIRRSALEDAGGWNEASITEDTELGLRLLERGSTSVYVEHSYGRGLIPDSFAAYAAQRFRWVYGGMQILKGHLGPPFAFWRAGLTAAQRYHFLGGWLIWIADALHLGFTACALAWTALVLALPRYADYPMTVFMATALGFLAFKLVKTFWLFTARTEAGVRDALGAMLAGLALSHTIGKAVWLGLFTRGAPFRRTPKRRAAPRLAGALAMVGQEAALAALLWAGAAAMAARAPADGGPAALWAAILVAQSLPYLAAVALSILGARAPAAPALGRSTLPAEGND